MKVSGESESEIMQGKHAVLWGMARERVGKSIFTIALTIQGMLTLHAAALWLWFPGYIISKLQAGLSITLTESGETELIPPMLMVLDCVLVGVWLYLLVRAWMVFNSMKGVWLALLMHPIVLGLYVIGYGGTLLGTLLLLKGVVTFNGGYCQEALAVLAVSLTSFWICAHGLRYVATHCAYENVVTFTRAFDDKLG